MANTFEQPSAARSVLISYNIKFSAIRALQFLRYFASGTKTQNTRCSPARENERAFGDVSIPVSNNRLLTGSTLSI